MKLLKTIILIRTNQRGIFIQSPTVNPTVGSGEVSRKIRIVNPSGAKKWGRKIKGKRIRKTIPEKDKQSIFGSIKVKQAFNHWCTLKNPMVAHIIGPSKTFTRSVILLKEYLKKYELSEIIKAMDLGKETFNASWFIYKRYFQKRKIVLPAFIKYTKEHKELLPFKIRPVDSWLEEFLKGREYIKANYSFILKDKYPHITERLTEAWKTYTKQDTLTTDESNGLIQLAVQIVKFVKANDNIISELDITDLIDQMLNKWDNRYKPKHPGWMLTPIFWENKLPKALVKYGTFENTRDINLI